LTPFEERITRPPELDAEIKPGKYLLFLGRLTPRKGVDVLLKALAQVPADGSVQLVVAGDGDILGNLQVLANQLGIAERVRFVGKVLGQKKVFLFQNALASIVPSRTWEAFGLVVLESYAAGTPVIASNLPGLADNVQPQRTGFLVAPEAPEELARRLKQALAQPKRMREMGEFARTIVGQYAWEHIAQQHVSLYERLIAVKAATRRAA
jgi:glycosyltransferase involved in cell wall biosynthesis